MIVSRFTDGFPGADSPSREIDGGPLYPSAEVMRLLEDHADRCIFPWTRKCVADIQKLDLDTEGLLGLLQEALTKGRFINSVWCEQRAGGPWAACDAYQLIRREWVSTANKQMNMEYYLKFAIGKTGTILLLVSCHP